MGELEAPAAGEKRDNPEASDEDEDMDDIGEFDSE